jgi:hypothetical protein
VELEPFRGTSFIGAAKLSPVTKLMAGTGAVSRYNVGRSQRFITVQELSCVQLRESGCKGVPNLSRCRSKAKTVTNNLPLLTVLATVVCYLSGRYPQLTNSSFDLRILIPPSKSIMNFVAISNTFL